MLKEILEMQKVLFLNIPFALAVRLQYDLVIFYHGRRKRGVTSLMSLSLCTSVSICGIVAPKRIDRFPRDFIHLKAR